MRIGDLGGVRGDGDVPSCQHLCLTTGLCLQLTRRSDWGLGHVHTAPAPARSPGELETQPRRSISGHSSQITIATHSTQLHRTPSSNGFTWSTSLVRAGSGAFGRGVGKCLLDGFRQLRRGEHVDDSATKSTAARADQSVSMLNPLLAVVDAESGIWVECVAMVMSRAVSTYALRRGCVSNSPGEATGAWGACVVPLDGLLVIVVPSPGVWVPRIALRLQLHRNSWHP